MSLLSSRSPFQLLEISLISAQDLAAVSRSMRTYAVAWVRPQRILTTRVDQSGRANPTWNEKFVFRVDDDFLNDESSAIMIEIYAVSWLRDVKIGTVRVLISNLIPHASKSTTRFVALQVRRPSGRPQGILNMGVGLLDSTLRSMPIYTDLSASAIGYYDLMDNCLKHKPSSSSMQNNKYSENSNSNFSHKIPLRRTQSERSHNQTKDDPTYDKNLKPAGSYCNGSACNGSMLNGSEVGAPKSAVGGNGSLCSDVGPSPSVVAAAIAKGIYPLPAPGNKNHKFDDMGSSILEDWTEKDSVEGLRSKLERWRTEMPAVVYDADAHKKRAQSSKGKHGRRRSDGGGLFSCFGNAYGLEISITCGGNKKKYGSRKVDVNNSDMDDDYEF